MVILLVLMAVSGTTWADEIWGLLTTLEAGTMSNNIFKLYEEDDLTEQITLGNNLYTSLKIRLFLWRFFVGGECDVAFFNFYTTVYNISMGGSFGLYPSDWLMIELGIRYKDRDSLAVPEHYHSTFLESYLKLKLSLGRTWE
jgi:hypothetical protein